MARTFTKDLANHLSLGIGVLGPLLDGASSILSVAQVRPSSYDTSTGDNAILWSIINASQVGLSLNISGLGGTNVVRVTARSIAADAVQDNVGDTAVTTGNWHLIAGLVRFPEDGFRTYLDSGTPDPGADGGEAFGAAAYTIDAPSNHDRIGRTQNAQTNQQFAGDIEHQTLWRDVSLAQANVIMANLQGGTKPYDITPAPLFCIVLGYATPDVDLIGGVIQSSITGSLPFVEGPTGLPPESDHRRLIIGGLASSAELSGTIVTQDADFSSTITPADTAIGDSGLNTFVFPGHRIISDIETQEYAPTLDRDRFWIAGIAAYKADVDGGTSTPEPTISSSLTAETTEGAEFFYQIDATNGAYLYSASPLPTGLVADTDLGQITGTVGAGTADTYNINLGATNDSGVGNATLVLTVHPAQPAPPGGVFKHKPLPMAIVATLGNIYHASSSKF